MIRVLIAHEKRLVCSLIAAALREEEDIHITGYATSLEECLSKAEKSDVVLIDAALPNSGALKVTEELASKQPQCHVIVLGVPNKVNVIVRYVEAGADGYVLSEVSADELLESIHAVHENKTLASPEVMRRVFDRVHELSRLCSNQEALIKELENLTPREQEVLDLISDGLSNQDISQKLSIEVGTVKNHVHNILEKLNVNSRHEAATIFRQGEAVRNAENGAT